ncbi:hypothetical protein CRX72_27095 [Pantoea sp. BRM17]|nr:hypothetical protein CRX72_27095 [Pantoea sp. BRM17]
MSTFIVILTVMLIGSSLAGITYWYAMRHCPPLARPLPFISPSMARYALARFKHKSTPQREIQKIPIFN